MQTALAVLDDPEEWPAFSRELPGESGCWESGVALQGMHCAACALTIEAALRSVPGVLGADVSSASRRARVRWRAGATQPSAWMLAIQHAGYGAVPAIDGDSHERRRLETRSALWRWLVAGFCMMQVMMYATPAYVAEPGDITPDMQQLLRWASWVLTLPVLAFSCGPFFRQAWRDLRGLRIGMDLPVALGILVTFAVSSAGTFDASGIFGREVYFDSLTMFVFFLLTGRWLETRLRERTAGALDALMNRLPDRVERRRADGAFEAVALRRLRAGDVMRVQPGEAFPADGIVLRGRTSVDEALLTGESRPVPRSPGGEVIAGSYNLSGVVEVDVRRIGAQTRFAQIVALMESAALDKPALARLADRIATPFLAAVLLAAAGACAFWWTRDPGHALMVAVAVLVVTCPCALSLATPAAMLASAGALARQGILVRRLQAFEALAGVDTVVFDKTGTLTREALALSAIRCRDDHSEQRVLAMAGALAQLSRHPVSRAIASAAQSAEAALCWHASGVSESAGEGVCGTVAPGARADFAPAALRLGSAAYCGVAGPECDVLSATLSDAQGWLATFELQEMLRPDAHAAVQALRAEGIDVWLLSGDSQPAVARIAGQVGIVQARGRCMPQDKLAALRTAQQEGRKLAMVGDGLNDGPVLAGADVSFSFGQSVPLAMAKADFVLPADRLMAVVQALRLARRTLRVVRQNLLWAAAYNAVCVPLAVVGWLPAWAAGLGMAASSLLVVVNALRLADRHAMPGAD
ncbi:MAG TPA: cation-translocating P-type ATPase [Burkholderiaceae bacterium]|nr:cation-translocating P-type ATPase [Burkholderiaceae bacterium]